MIEKKVLKIEGLVCEGCNTPFEYDECGVLINHKPYCSDDCYWEVTPYEEFDTEESLSIEEQTAALLGDVPKDLVEKIIEVGKLHALDLTFLRHQ